MSQRKSLREKAMDVGKAVGNALSQPVVQQENQFFSRTAFQSMGSTLQAMVREGSKDAWNQLIPAFPDHQKGVDEPGLPATKTQYEVNSEKGLTSQSLYGKEGKSQHQKKQMNMDM